MAESSFLVMLKEVEYSLSLFCLSEGEFVALAIKRVIF